MGIMGIFSYLATAGSEAAEGGFGLNFNILETNLINLGIIIAVLFVYGRPLVNNILQERRSRIEAEVRDAENRAKQAEAALAEAKKNLEQAQQEAQRIRTEAQAAAQKAKEEVLQQGRQEVAKIQAAGAKELDTEQAKVLAELRQRVATLALAKVESELKTRLVGDVQSRLVDRSIAQLGGDA